MASPGSLSSHLMNSHNAAQSPRAPFGQPSHNITHIATCGPMSYNASVHGASPSSGFAGTQQSFWSDSSYSIMSEESERKIAALQAKLNKKLGPEFISQRPGPGGGPKLTYAEGWKVINLANEVFGFNGWSSTIVSLTTDFIDYSEQSARYSVGVTAIVRVTLRDGVFHEDVGYGLLENSKSKGAALDKCKKEAVTDAIKRTLRNFGNLLGNCLYDKAYTQEVVKIKVPPAKLDKSELHRRPEFEEGSSRVPNGSAAVSAAPSLAAGPSSVKAERPPVKQEPILPMMPPPAHLPNRTSFPPPQAISTPNAKGKTVLTSTAENGSASAVSSASAPSLKNDDPLSKLKALRHAQRMKAIQEAQEAQHREQGAAQAAPQHALPSNSSNVPQVVSSGPVQVLAKGAAATDHDGSDDYTFSSDDDAFFANADLSTLDEGVGRPIDFDEGAGVDDEMTEAASNGQPQPQPQPQAPQAASNPPVEHRRVQPSAFAHGNVNGKEAPQSNGTGPSTPIDRARTPSMGGGFNFPSAPNQHHAQSMNQGARSASLKRTAAIMEGIQQAQAAQRRPQQGMGLQHAGASSATGGGVRREQYTPAEAADAKRARHG